MNAEGRGRFSRTSRLTSPREFRHVFAEPTRLSDSGFLVLFAPNNANTPRLGLAVSKRNVKRSVDRNKLKRLVRESFRVQSTGLPNVDIVVLVRPNAARIPSRDLLSALGRVWEQVRR